MDFFGFSLQLGSRIMMYFFSTALFWRDLEKPGDVKVSPTIPTVCAV
jgi:hypothetical protein